jgi:hypothetical protein
LPIFSPAPFQQEHQAPSYSRAYSMDFIYSTAGGGSAYAARKITALWAEEHPPIPAPPTPHAFDDATSRGFRGVLLVLSLQRASHFLCLLAVHHHQSLRGVSGVSCKTPKQSKTSPPFFFPCPHSPAFGASLVACRLRLASQKNQQSTRSLVFLFAPFGCNCGHSGGCPKIAIAPVPPSHQLPLMPQSPLLGNI